MDINVCSDYLFNLGIAKSERLKLRGQNKFNLKFTTLGKESCRCCSDTGEESLDFAGRDTSERLGAVRLRKV